MLILILSILCLAPFVSSGVALLAGAALALTIGNPHAAKTKVVTPRLLALSVMGLGAGMDLSVVAKVGLQGVGYTVAGISLTLLLGTLLGRLLSTGRNTSILLTVGTAICGGSAIAAVAPTIRAKDHEVSVALGVVFLLNAVGLIIFPPIGHALSLSQKQFGLWSALAIHDTSSVVGAAIQYGSEALQTGTTVKLARALWIVPVTLVASRLFNSSESADGVSTRAKPKRPWFILGFLVAAAIVTWIPALKPAGHWVELVAKRCLVLTLFLIGCNLSRATLQAVGIRPLLQALILWIVVASTTLLAIGSGWIHALS
jgi:uncharacterized integral membrane protein (TIGR00698 family)